MSAAVLEVEDVSVRFGGLTALSKVNLAVPHGSITGLVGPNGAGKTTLFGVISGLQRTTAGDVWMDGERVTDARPERRARLGMARTFQRAELFAELTVRQHLVFGFRARHRPPRLWADLLGLGRASTTAEREEVDRLLDALGLMPVAERPAGALPLGTGRLVEVGRALATGPKVLLLDEPSSGLDTTETEQLADVLVRAVRDEGVALLLVEHNLDLVLGICDMVHVLDFGEMIAAGTPAQVRSDPAVQAAYIGSMAE